MVCREIDKSKDRVEEEDSRSSMDSKRKIGNYGKEGVTYIITCKTCGIKGRNVKYIGETSRTGYLCGLEHMKDKETKKEDSPLAKHDEIFHHDREKGGDYYMEIDQKFHRPHFIIFSFLGILGFFVYAPDKFKSPFFILGPLDTFLENL